MRGGKGHARQQKSPPEATLKEKKRKRDKTQDKVETTRKSRRREQDHDHREEEITPPSSQKKKSLKYQEHYKEKQASNTAPRHLVVHGDIQDIAKDLVGVQKGFFSTTITNFLKKIRSSNDSLEKSHMELPCTLIWADLPCSLAPFEDSNLVPDWNQWGVDLLCSSLDIVKMFLSPNGFFVTTCDISHHHVVVSSTIAGSQLELFYTLFLETQVYNKRIVLDTVESVRYIALDLLLFKCRGYYQWSLKHLYVCCCILFHRLVPWWFHFSQKEMAMLLKIEKMQIWGLQKDALQLAWIKLWKFLWVLMWTL